MSNVYESSFSVTYKVRLSGHAKLKSLEWPNKCYKNMDSNTQARYVWCVCVHMHKINEIDNIWLNNKKKTISYKLNYEFNYTCLENNKNQQVVYVCYEWCWTNTEKWR